MEKVQGDLLTCPICFEIPDDEIYQCKNGHSICDSCSDRVKTCPQCMVRYGKKLVRNRALEDLIGSMEISCRYRELGCTSKVMRRDVQAHGKSCQFRPFQLCKRIPRFKTCTYGSSNVSNIICHFRDVHGSNMMTTKSLVSPLTRRIQKWLKGENCVGVGGIYSLHTLEEVVPANYFVWTSSVIAQGDFQVVCPYLGEKLTDVFPFLVKLEVDAPDREVNWSWSGRPSHYRNAKAIIASPPLRVPIKDILGLCDKGADSNIHYKLAFYEK